MKLTTILYFSILLSFCHISQGRTLHTYYDASSDYKRGDIVPSQDANIFFYQSNGDLVGGTHSLSNTLQWTAVTSSSIPNSGLPPSVPSTDSGSKDVPESKNLLSLNTTIGGSATGGGQYEKGVSATIESLPLTGYLFSEWSGDASGSANPITVSMDSNKSITANFIQDLNDDDGDGLTNFAELVTYGTDPSKQDTDGDSIFDSKEVEIGSNPKTSDSAVYNLGLEEGYNSAVKGLGVLYSQKTHSCVSVAELD